MIVLIQNIFHPHYTIKNLAIMQHELSNRIERIFLWNFALNVHHTLGKIFFSGFEKVNI